MHSHTGNQSFVASRVRSLTRGGARISPTKLDQDHCHNRIMRHFKIEKKRGSLKFNSIYQSHLILPCE